MPNFCGLEYEAEAEGDVSYRPAHAPPGRGFGEWEVHPQKIRARVEGQIGLRHNGDWLAYHVNGSHFAFPAKRGGRASAERACALWNGGRPTRVVDLADNESTSIHTLQSVKAEAERKGIQIPMSV